MTPCPACDRCDGEPCEGGPRTCSVARDAALKAGIPLDVVEGRAKLSDHFSPETIALMCGREPNE